MAEGTDLDKDNFWSWDVWQSLWPFQLFYFCPLSTASAGLFPPPSLTLPPPQPFTALAKHCAQPSLLCLLPRPTFW